MYRRVAIYAELLGSYYKTHRARCPKGAKEGSRIDMRLMEGLHDDFGERIRKDELCPILGSECEHLSNEVQLFRNKFGHVNDWTERDNSGEHGAM